MVTPGPACPPPQGPRGASGGAGPSAAERGEASAGEESLVRHEAAEGGAMAAAGWGLLRDVHGRGDQVRIHDRRWVVLFPRRVGAVGDYNSRRALRRSAARPRRAVGAGPLGTCSLTGPGPSAATGMAATEYPPGCRELGGC